MGDKFYFYFIGVLSLIELQYYGYQLIAEVLLFL